jgi:rRNA-processing protein FCF1
MKILMDADCLIKLTKAGLKEFICLRDQVVIPLAVKREVVDAGKLKNCCDAGITEENIKKGLIEVIQAGEKKSTRLEKGDQALTAAFKLGRYAVVATDDAKYIRTLRAENIPYILPALIIYRLFRQGTIDRGLAIASMEALAPFISEDEYNTTRLLLEEKI